MQSPVETPQESPSTANSAGRDRRKEPRYAAEVQDARLGWWRNQQFVTAEAMLRDISSGGAALVVDPDLRAAHEVWFCVASGGGAVWVPGRVTALRSIDEGVQRVCLEFSHACPYDVFKVAAWGSPPAPSPRGGPDVESATDSAALATSVASTTGSPPWESSSVRQANAASDEDAGLEEFESEPAPASLVPGSPHGRAEPGLPRRSPVIIALDWLVPAALCLSMGVAIICLSYGILSNSSMLEPLLASLRGE